MDGIDLRELAQAVFVDTAVGAGADVDRASADHDAVDRPDVFKLLGQDLGAPPELDRSPGADHDIFNLAGEQVFAAGLPRDLAGHGPTAGRQQQDDQGQGEDPCATYVA